MRGRRYLLRSWRSERGSQGLEAAAAALAAALIVLALLAGARGAMGPRVLEAFQCAAAALGGGGGCGGGAAVADGTGSARPQAAAQQAKGGFGWLDGLQLGLDAVGLVPGFGELADGVNGLISLARGDTTGALLSLGAMVPFAGWAATGGKWVRTGIKYSDEATAAANVAIKCTASSPRGKGPGLAKPIFNAGCLTFPAKLSSQLEKVLKKYPGVSGKCNTCADQVALQLQKAGYDVDIVRLQNSDSTAPYMVVKDPANPGDLQVVGTQGWHEVVRIQTPEGPMYIDSVVYEHTKGARALPWQDYTNLWGYPEDIVEVSSRTP